MSITNPIVGQLLDGRYRVGGLIARGGMATVFEAVDTRLDRRVAIKVLDAELARDPGFERRFVREAKAAASLSHPNVVAVFDQGRDGDTLFLVMEFIPGRTLRQLLAAEGRLSVELALSITDDVLAALAAAHRAGLVHRDIKPENVLIDEHCHVKVADFGLARAVATTEQSTTRGVVLGTVSYLAPEQVERGAVDERTDIYATGILAFELLTGQRPFIGDNPLQVAYQHVHSDVPAPSTLVPTLPAAVDELVTTATSRDPAARYPDAGTFAEHLRRATRAAPTRVGATLGPSAAEPTRRLVDDTAVDPSGTSPLGLETAAALAPLFADDPDDPDRPRPSRRRRGRRRRWPLLVLVLLLVVVGGSAAGYYSLMAGYTQAPDLAKLTIRAANTEAGHSELFVHLASRVYSETVPAGEIIRADPSTGARIRKHTAIDVVLSRGPERYAVPTLAGKTVDQATTALSARHLKVGKTTSRYDQTAPTDTLLSSHPNAGTPQRRGTTVDIVVSKGRQPIAVPDVRTETETDAVSAIEALHLKVVGTKAYSDTIPTGHVISQQPGRGTLFRNDTVHVVVSKGPELVTVPSVRGHGVDGAAAALRAAGLQVVIQHAQLYVGAGLVVGESPGGNEVVHKGSTVTLTIV